MLSHFLISCIPIECCESSIFALDMQRTCTKQSVKDLLSQQLICIQLFTSSWRCEGCVCQLFCRKDSSFTQHQVTLLKCHVTLLKCHVTLLKCHVTPLKCHFRLLKGLTISSQSLLYPAQAYGEGWAHGYSPAIMRSVQTTWYDMTNNKTAN